MPIYQDVIASVESIKKLRDIKGIRHFLSTWDEPMKDDDVYQRLDEECTIFSAYMMWS